VRAGQWEIRVVMVERSSRPGGRGMASRTVRGEAGLHVIRVGCCVEIVRVTAEAIRGSSRELPVDVAAGARDADVRADERETCRVVIERAAIPGCGGMAGLAGSGEARLDVVGIAGAVEITGVAAKAVR